MSNVGYATLSVIPSFQGFQNKLATGVAAPMASAGKSAGSKFGGAAGQAAGTSFKGRFTQGIKGAAAPLAGLFAVGAAVNWAKTTFDSLARIEKINAQTASAIKATGGAAQVTAGHVEGLAGRLETLTATEAESIQEGANLLLTFKNIRNGVGQGNDIFDQTTKIMVDMARVMGTDAKGGAIQLGKALNDPVKGITALTRVGVTFSQQQKNQIKAFAEAGDTMSAQKLILAELKSEFEGAGEAYAGTTRGKIDLAIHKFGELSETMLANTLPAASKLADGFTNNVAPGIAAASSAVGQVGSAFGSLPGPVKAAAGAFAALKLAGLLGLTGRVSAGAGKMAGAMTGLRVRTMLAADAFRSARSGMLQLSGNTGRFIAPVGRMNAAMQGIRAGAVGAGTALRRGLGGAVGMLGGPWGIAFIGAIAVLAKFRANSAEAKARVEALTDSLNKQTGAATKNTAELQFNTLQKSGAIDAAKKLGINLEEVRRASMGNGDALKALNAELEKQIIVSGASGSAANDHTGAQVDASNAARKLKAALGETSGELDKAKRGQKDLASFTGKSTEVTAQATRTTRNYADRVAAARDAVRELFQAENKRRDAAVQAKRDEIALIQTMRDAEREARKGKATLDENTKAGRNNWNALLDLADQWNNSKGSVRNARGAYRDMRDEFIKVAKQMGANDDKAKRLADRFLHIPKRVKTQFTTPGMDEALEKLRTAKTLIESFDGSSVRINGTYGGRFQKREFGGPVKAGVPYIVGERRPELFVPEVNGRIEPRVNSTSNSLTIQGVTVVAHDYDDFTSQLRSRAQRSQMGGA